MESLGYAALYLPDHFDDQLGPIAALMAAADATTTLRVGSLVFDNDYRHPVVLAKEAATIDVLSDGRLDLGLGAGWLASDYERAGLPYDSPGTRIERMGEGLQVIKGLLAGGKYSAPAGKHYREFMDIRSQMGSDDTSEAWDRAGRSRVPPLIPLSRVDRRDAAHRPARFT